MSDPAKSPSGQDLSLSRALTFSAGTIPVSALTVALFVYLPHYFASHLGVSLTAIGIAWAAVRIFDFFVDPFLAFAMDKTRTAFGRYRVWLVAGAPVFMLGVFALFEAPKGIGGYYLFIWLLVLYVGISILYLSHSAWAATLATNYHQRSRVFGLLAAVGVAASVIELFVPIVTKRMGHNDAFGVQAMGWFVIAVTPLAVALAAWSTPERITSDIRSGRLELIECFSLLRRPDLLRLIATQLALTLGPGWMSALYLFFFVAARGYSSDQATQLLVIYIVAGVAGALATGRIATRLGKHRTLMLTTSLYSLGLCFVMAVPKASMLGALPIMFWCGFMASGFDLMIRAMIADVGDEIRLEQGKERISLLYSMLALASKAAGALAIGLSYPLLKSLVGYDPTEGAVNTHQAIIGLEWVFLTGPIFFVTLGGACVIGWKLDAVRHAEVRSALDERDAQFDEAPGLETSPVRSPVAVLAADADAATPVAGD